jgi:hypothetical protein
VIPFGIIKRNISETHLKYNNNINYIKIKSRDKKIQCDFCDKIFTTKTNKYRHMRKSCKIKKNICQREKIYKSLIADMNNRIKKLEIENKNLKNSSLVVHEQDNSTNTNNTNCTNNENNTNCTNNANNANNTTNNNCNNGIINNNHNNLINVNLVAFGQEDMNVLTNSEVFDILRRGFSSVPELVKAIHFNKKRPENHNIYISNMRDSYVMVYDGERWSLKDRNETINNMFDEGRNFLVFRHEDMKKKYNDKHKKMVRKFNRFNYEIDHCLQKKMQILKDIKLILYNNISLPLGILLK